MDTIARNHNPHTAAGIPPALAMTGRSDVMAGCASTIWNYDPESVEAVIAKRQNAMRNILNVRNAAIAASSQQDL